MAAASPMWHAYTWQTFARFVDQSQPWRVFFHLKKDFFPGAGALLARRRSSELAALVAPCNRPLAEAYWRFQCCGRWYGTTALIPPAFPV